MVQIGNVPQINEVKTQLEALREKGLVRAWEVPYENILTRLTAAIFFLTPTQDPALEEVWASLGQFPRFTYRPNEEKELSQLDWRLEFNKDFEL